jgi:Cgr1 family
MSRKNTTRVSSKNNTAFFVQQARRKLADQAKDVSKRMKEEKEQFLNELKAKREEKRRRKAENTLKSTKYQVISDPKTLKRMTKKQLRSVQKTRVNKDGNVELVGVYSK